MKDIHPMISFGLSKNKFTWNILYDFCFAEYRMWIILHAVFKQNLTTDFSDDKQNIDY